MLLTIEQLRTLRHQQGYFARYGKRDVMHWRRADDVTIDSRDLDAMAAQGLFTRQAGGPATYGDVSYSITNKGLDTDTGIIA